MLNQSNIHSIPSNLKDDFNLPQPDPGENCEIPEPLKLTKDMLLEEIEKLKSKFGQQNLTDRIVKALKIVKDETSNLAPRRNGFKRKNRLKIDPENVTFGKRGRRAEVQISQNVKTTAQSKSRLLK